METDAERGGGTVATIERLRVDLEEAKRDRIAALHGDPDLVRDVEEAFANRAAGVEAIDREDLRRTT